jgi:signal transduction histidine kinase
VLFDDAPPHEMPMVEGRLARGDGSSVDVEVAARAFRYRGEPAVLVVARDITRRKKAERHVLTISERERSGFGRDLHDSLCQSLMGAACMAEALRNDLRRTGSAAAQADQIARVIRQCVEEARSLARGLCPVTMEKSGLVAALHELTAEVAGRTRVGCALECDDSLTINDVSVATNLYRIAQEAVANAIKHGQAKSVLIQLAANNGRMTLRVQDDGKGIPAKPKQSGMGLHTMRYRATIIGGSLEVRRDRPRGTVVTCTFPSNAGAP